MAIDRISHRTKLSIGLVAAATSVASLLITGLTQEQAQAISLTFNSTNNTLDYDGTLYNLSVENVTGDSAGVVGNFWYGLGDNGALANSVALLLSGIFSNQPLAYQPGLLPNTVAIVYGESTSRTGFFTADVRPYVIANIASTSVPEPFTIIGTLIGGTAAFRMKKKLGANK